MKLHSSSLSRVRLSIALALVLGLTMLPMEALAASSWSPTLLVNTESFQVIDEGDGSTDVEIRFGSTLNEILEFDRTNSRFHFTDDLGVDGNLSASGTLSIEGASSLQGNVTSRGSFSGASVHVEGTLSASGTVFLQGTLTGALAFHGPFTSDCDDPTNSKLLWDSATGKFSCGSDQTGGTAAWTDGGDFLYTTNGEDVVVGGTTEASYEVKINTGSRISATFSGGLVVNEAGNDNDTRMEGDTDINLFFLDASTDRLGIGTATPETKLDVIGTLSGSSLRISNGADIHGALAASGAVRTDGNLTLNDDQTADTDAVLTFGSDDTNETLRFADIGDRFELSDDLATTGSLNASGAILTEGNLTINDDADSNNAVLTFGSDTTNETLTWNNSNDTFQFSDDLNTTGTLSASGAVSFESTTSFGGIVYTWPGGVAAESGHLLSVNPVTGQLSWTSGVSSSGSIISLMPEYDGAIYFNSGATFVGQLVASGSVAVGGSPENFYRWTTTSTSDQDYWISTRVRIPSNFRSWDPVAPIQFRYRGSGGTLDMRLLDTGDAIVPLTGAADLRTNNTTWSTATITGPQSAGTYTVDDQITILVKLTASGAAVSNDQFADAGWIELNWETKD